MTVTRAMFDDLIEQYKVERQFIEKRYTDLHAAYDVDEDRSVTLDIVRLTDVNEQEFISGLLSRAKSLAQIRHPNIARVYGTGRTPDGRPFVAQARESGTSLQRRMGQLAQRGAPTNSVYALKLVRQVAEALLLAERLGLYHYELTPANIWLKDVARPTDESVLLLDLFMPCRHRPLAPSVDAEDQAGYLSPEQIAGRSINSRSHIYSMGAMLFGLLAGRAPDRPVGLAEAGLRRLTSGPTALQRLRADLTDETYGLVDRAMRAENGRRHEDITDFIGVLDEAISAEEAGRVAVNAVPESTRASRTLEMAIPVMAAITLLVAMLALAWNRGSADHTVDAAPYQTPAQGGALAAATQTTEPTRVMVASATPALVASLAKTRDGTRATTMPPAATPQLLTEASPSPTATPTVSQTPSATPSATPSPTPVVPQARVVVNAANLRGGPGMAYDDVGQLARGDVVEIVAYVGSPDSYWYLVRMDDGQLGWLWPQLVEPLTTVDLADLAAAATVPPSPTPWPTVVPTATVTVAPVPDDLPPPPADPQPPTQPTPPPPTAVQPTAEPPTRTPPPLSGGG